MTGYMPPLHMPLEPKWRHYPTYIYDMNYGYGMNYYQPMMDYIDHKGRAETWLRDYKRKLRPELPDLPWSDGRLVWEDREVIPYSWKELISRSVDAEDRAREHLSRFKVANRSDFSLSKTAQASHVTRDIFPRSLEQARRKALPLLVRSAVARSRAESLQKMMDIEIESLKDVQRMSEVHDALQHGKSLRGKSARAIEFHLRAEALKNLSKSQELADIRKYQRDNVHVLWDDRDHLKLMEERTRNLLDEEKLAAPLCTLSRELRGYEQKSSNYFLDKRYRDPRRPARLYGCLG